MSEKKSRRAFITGSYACAPRVGGDKSVQSDIDLVVFVSEDDAQELRGMAENRTGSGSSESLSLRFGQLNLIVETTEEKYDAWIIGTKALQKVQERRMLATNGVTYPSSAVTRGEAVAVFKRLFLDLSRCLFSFRIGRATLEQRRAWEEERLKGIMDKVAK